MIGRLVVVLAGGGNWSNRSGNPDESAYGAARLLAGLGYGIHGWKRGQRVGWANGNAELRWTNGAARTHGQKGVRRVGWANGIAGWVGPYVFMEV